MKHYFLDVGMGGMGGMGWMGGKKKAKRRRVVATKMETPSSQRNVSLRQRSHRRSRISVTGPRGESDSFATCKENMMKRQTF